jgi:hypothetical protein
MSDAITDHFEIARTIRGQIMAGDRWALAACGARDYMAFPAGQEWIAPKSQPGDLGGLKFRVTITSSRIHNQVIITLADDDTYRVALIKVKRGSYEIELIEEHTGIYCDMLADTVYHMCNK